LGVSGVRLYLAAVYDPAGAGGAGTAAGLVAAGLCRSGRQPRQTFRYVVLPLAIPGIAAGSIFTFSLTLGDFIVPQLVGPPGYFIGNMVYSQQGAIGNMPMAAAFTLVPLFLFHSIWRS
jgi:ABC-type spermidine/putrescine transport system permease subunit I